LKTLLALLKTMRPRQWAKNAFVFVGILFDAQLFTLDALWRVLGAFVLLCLTASAIYLINDLVDVEKDRQHPKKRTRPIASGDLPVGVARVASVILPILAIGGALSYSVPLAIVLIAYFVQHVIYSYWLKNVVILDIFAIAFGFVLRTVAGIVVISVTNFSPWLYAFVGLLSLFLAIGKRRQELILLGEEAAIQHRPAYKDYNLPFLDDMLRLSFTSAAITYTLYAVEAETALVPSPYMLLTVPFVYYALFRYLYLIHVRGDGGDPTEVLYTDRPLQASIALFGVVIIVLLYSAPRFLMTGG
jgi:4-hydroxybenzoate polyprenyltransferase